MDKIKEIFDKYAGIIIFSAAVIVIVSGVVDAVLQKIISEYEMVWASDALRAIIITLAALGGLYGLVVATRRLNLNQKGFFNDTFSRGAELSGHNE